MTTRKRRSWKSGTTVSVPEPDAEEVGLAIAVVLFVVNLLRS